MVPSDMMIREGNTDTSFSCATEVPEIANDDEKWPKSHTYAPQQIISFILVPDGTKHICLQSLKAPH